MELYSSCVQSFNIILNFFQHNFKLSTWWLSPCWIQNFSRLTENTEKLCAGADFLELLIWYQDETSIDTQASNYLKRSIWQKGTVSWFKFSSSTGFEVWVLTSKCSKERHYHEMDHKWEALVGTMLIYHLQHGIVNTVEPPALRTCGNCNNQKRQYSQTPI